jgi:hypothetical protein
MQGQEDTFGCYNSKQEADEAINILQMQDEVQNVTNASYGLKLYCSPTAPIKYTVIRTHYDIRNKEEYVIYENTSVRRLCPFNLLSCNIL